MLMKTQELAHFLTGKKKKIDFTKPQPQLKRIDNQELREKILNISYYKWMKAGYSKGGLHYMKQNAKKPEPFTLNKHIQERLIRIIS